MNPVEMTKWLNLGLTIAQAASEGVAIAIEARDLVKRLVAEQRDPTEEEWARINQVVDELVKDILEA